MFNLGYRIVRGHVHVQLWMSNLLGCLRLTFEQLERLQIQHAYSTNEAVSDDPKVNDLAISTMTYAKLAFLTSQLAIWFRQISSVVVGGGRCGWLGLGCIEDLRRFNNLSVRSGDTCFESVEFKWRDWDSNPGPLAAQAKSLTTGPLPLPLSRFKDWCIHIL